MDEDIALWRQHMAAALGLPQSWLYTEPEPAPEPRTVPFPVYESIGMYVGNVAGVRRLELPTGSEDEVAGTGRSGSLWSTIRDQTVQDIQAVEDAVFLQHCEEAVVELHKRRSLYGPWQWVHRFSAVLHDE